MNRIEHDDEVTIILKGKVGYSGAKFKFTLPQPQLFPKDLGAFCYSIEQGMAERSMEFTLKDPEIQVEHKSKYKNGVYLDLADRSYWMRRPDGWHRMVIPDDRPKPLPGLRPDCPQRLKEDR